MFELNPHIVPQGSILVSFMLLWGRLLQKIAARQACRAAIFGQSLSHKKDAGFHVVKTVLNNTNR